MFSTEGLLEKRMAVLHSDDYELGVVVLTVQIEGECPAYYLVSFKGKKGWSASSIKNLVKLVRRSRGAGQDAARWLLEQPNLASK